MYYLQKTLANLAYYIVIVLVKYCSIKFGVKSDPQW